jgi:hypothetical protein
VLWAVAFARAVTRANGASFPADADAAFARGTRFLADLAGEIGVLPSIGESPSPDLLSTKTPLPWTLRNLALAWGLDTGVPAPGAAADPRLGWLRGRPAGPPESWSGKTWAVWSYREGSVGIGWLLIKGQPSRVVLDAGLGSGALSHPGTLSLHWQVGAVGVLSDPGTGAGATDLCEASRSILAHNCLSLLEATPSESGLDRARVDGKKAKMEGWATVGAQRQTRDVLLNQSRLLVTDRLETGGRVQLTWQLGPGWVLEKTAEGYTGKNGTLSLVILLPMGLEWRLLEGRPAPEPAGWVWKEGVAEAAPCLVGTGEMQGGTKILSSFEIR